MILLRNLGYSFIITNKALLFACGCNRDGQLGLNDKQDRNQFTQVTEISGTLQQLIMQNYHSFILTSSGLYACGNNMYGQLGIASIEDILSFQPVYDVPIDIKESWKLHQQYQRLINIGKALKKQGLFHNLSKPDNTPQETDNAKSESLFRIKLK